MPRTVIIAAIIVTTFLCCNAQDGVYSHGSVRYDGKWELDGWNKPPGIKARVTQKAFDYLTYVGYNRVLDKILEGQIKIPDIQGSKQIAGAKVEYRVNTIQMMKVGGLTDKFTLIPKPLVGGLELNTGKLDITLRARFWIKATKWHLHKTDSGKVYIDGNAIQLSVSFRVGIDSHGRPTVLTVPGCPTCRCYFNIAKLALDFYGTTGLIDKYTSQIESAVKDALHNQVCGHVTNMINTNLRNKLRTLTMTAPIRNMVEIDYSLVQNPTFFGSMDTASKGEVYPFGKREECPIVPTKNITTDNDTSHMFISWISDYLPNSAGYVLQKAGCLKYNVTPDNVPPEMKTYLNTSTPQLKFILPQISKQFPDMGMQIYIASTKAPMASITPDGIGAIFVGNTSLFAILPNKTLAFLFSLNVTLATRFTVSTNGNNVTWKIASLSTKLSVVRTAIGNIDAAKLENALNMLIKLVLIPKLNQIGQNGVPLPDVKGFTFIQPSISLDKGFLKFGADLKYTRE